MANKPAKDPVKKPAKDPEEEPAEEPGRKADEETLYCPFCPNTFAKADMLRWRSHVAGHSSHGSPEGIPTGGEQGTHPAGKGVIIASSQSAEPEAAAPLFRGAQSPLEQRLTEVLDGLRVEADARKFVLSYWRGVADIQNPWGLYDLLMKTTGIGATNAKLATDYVFAAGGATQPTNPYLPVKDTVTHEEEPQDSYDKWVDRMFSRVDREMKYRQVQKMMKDMGMVEPGEPHKADRPPLSSEEEAQEMVRGMMSSINAAMRTRVMLQAFSPVLGPQAQTMDMIPRPRIGSDGKPVLDEGGTPVVDWIPMSPRGQQVVDMMQRFDRGESVDPMKLATAMMDIFTKGVQFGRPEKGEGVPTKDLLDMQARIHESQVDTLKAQFGATEKLFDQERQFVRQQFEAMSPERQMEQIEKWKKLGLLGGDNLEAMKLQLRMRMWETERADAKEQQVAQSQAQIAESERARQQFHELIDLGKNALTDALKPVTMAIGDGIRQRVAYGPPAPGAAPPPPPGAQAPPDYASMSPEQRAEYRAKLDEIQQKVNAERARLDAGGG